MNYHTVKLLSIIDKALIIAYQESTEILKKTLANEGFQYQVLRQKEQAEHQNFSSSYLCLLNHRKAWEIAAEEGKKTLVIEADFVPVVGFGQLPLPFNSKNQRVGIAWLYTCAPQLYNVSVDGYADGFSASTVAYIITPDAAKYLIDLEVKVRKEIGTNCYSAWDSNIDSFLRDKNFINYIPFRNYGEHGGIPNLEHHRHGLSRTHRADILYNSLAFIPIYANQERENHLHLFVIRLLARIKGLLRLICGKYLRCKLVKKSKTPIRLVTFSIYRQLTIRL